MKKKMLSLAVVGLFIIATSACISTRSTSGTGDNSTMDSTSTTTPTDTTNTTMMP